jgi:hypothetical protein
VLHTAAGVAPARNGVATYGGRRCSRRGAAVIHTAAGAAPMRNEVATYGGRCCYTQRPTVLHTAASVAPVRSGGATDGRRCWQSYRRGNGAQAVEVLRGGRLGLVGGAGRGEKEARTSGWQQTFCFVFLINVDTGQMLEAGDRKPRSPRGRSVLPIGYRCGFLKIIRSWSSLIGHALRKVGHKFVQACDMLRTN